MSISHKNANKIFLIFFSITYVLNVGNTSGFYDFFKSIFFQTILVSKDVEFNGKLHDK
jgi:hypothetical protein